MRRDERRCAQCLVREQMFLLPFRDDLDWPWTVFEIEEGEDSLQEG